MLVDDAVVVVESIYYRLQRGMAAPARNTGGFARSIRAGHHRRPDHHGRVLPLMLLPGILGKYMLVIPLVVTIALAL